MPAAMILVFIADRTHPAEIDPTPKRRKIAKFRLQFLLEHSKRFLKRTYFSKIEVKMIKFWCFKKGSIIAKSRLQILAENLQRFPKRTYFFKIDEKMT